MSNRKGSKRISEKTVFVSKDNRYVLKEVVDIVNGKKIKKLFRKGGLGSVTVVPVLNRDSILLIREYRPAIRRGGKAGSGWLYSLPSGQINHGETVEKAARRELEEEAGYSAQKVVFLYDRYIAPWLTDGIDSVCLASGLSKTLKKPEDDEIISIVPTKVSKVIKMLKSGDLKDLAARDALLYWLNFLKK